MTTSITYDGVPSAQGGNIFKNTSFWVAQRVPIRKHFIDLIESNGGRVVLLEKDADMLIADCGKPKHAPPNSYSWKFIEDSVKHGIAQLHDRYRIGRDPDLPRPVASGGLTKGTRTPFTKADDALLAKWVLSHTVDRTGNKIFQEYEAMNPRHTWQSWRNRFIKTLSLLPTDKLEQLAASASTEEQRQEVQTVTPAPDVADVDPLVQRPGNHLVPKQRIASRNNQVDSCGNSDRDRLENYPRAPSESQETVPRAESQPEDDIVGMSQFHRDFTDFMQLRERQAQLETRIGPQTVKLWNLLQAVEGQKVPPEEVDWIRVAEELGYDWAHSREAAARLRQCYEEDLLPFLDAMDDFVSESGSDGPDDNDEQQHVSKEVPLLVRARSPSYVPSSPPVAFTKGKRPLDLQLDISSTNDTKRRRLSRDFEIPSTPDEELRSMPLKSSLRHQSPSLRRSMMQQNQLLDSEASQHLPPLPGANSKTAESELRDHQIQKIQPLSEILAREESFDVTPSQQLQSEHIDATPIPFPLDAGRREQRTSSDEPSPRPQQPGLTSKHLEAAPVATASSSLVTSLAPSRPKSTKTSKRSLPLSFASSAAGKAPATAVSGTRSNPEVAANKNKPQGTGGSNLDEIGRWVEYYESLGYSNRTVVEALKRTTMIPGGLAGIVMQSLKDGQGVPSHHEGIWTDRDDKSLRLVMSLNLGEQPRDSPHAQQLKKARKEHARLVNKHGAARLELRKKFLTAGVGDGDGAVHG